MSRDRNKFSHIYITLCGFIGAGDMVDFMKRFYSDELSRTVL